MSNVTIGQQLRDRRKFLGVGQKVIAKHAGISISYLSLIERDERDPSLRVLNRVACAVGAKVFLLWEKL